MKSILDSLSIISGYQSYNKTTTVSETIDRNEDGSYRTSSSTIVNEVLTPMTKAKPYMTNNEGRVVVSSRGRRPIKREVTQPNLSTIHMSMFDTIPEQKIPKAKSRDIVVHSVDNTNYDNDSNVIEFNLSKGA